MRLLMLSARRRLQKVIWNAQSYSRLCHLEHNVHNHNISSTALPVYCWYHADFFLLCEIALSVSNNNASPTPSCSCTKKCSGDIKLSDDQVQTKGALPNTSAFLPLWSPEYSIEDQASSFFFHHFVVRDSSRPLSLPAFLPSLFNRQFSTRSAFNPLPGVITSIGMAGISNIQNSPAGMLATRQKHSSTLRALNAALQDPIASSEDSTIMAVMLLGTFEVFYPLPLLA